MCRIFAFRPSRSHSARSSRGQPGRVQSAGIGDDLDAAVERLAQHVFHLLEERHGVTARGLLLPAFHRIIIVSSAR